MLVQHIPGSAKLCCFSMTGKRVGRFGAVQIKHRIAVTWGHVYWSDAGGYLIDSQHRQFYLARQHSYSQFHLIHCQDFVNRFMFDAVRDL